MGDWLYDSVELLDFAEERDALVARYGDDARDGVSAAIWEMFQSLDLTSYPVAAPSALGPLRRAFVLPRGACPALCVYFVVKDLKIGLVSVRTAEDAGVEGI